MTLSTLRVLAKGDVNVFAESIKDFGLRIVGSHNTDPLESRVQVESVSAIASAIMEDVNDQVELPKKTLQVMRLAEEFGYIVKVA